MDNENKVERWKRYIEELYQETDGNTHVQNNGSTDEQGRIILRDDYNKALEDMKRNKAPGVDNIPIELIENSEETIKEELFKLVKEIYESGTIPEDFQKSIIISIPKKLTADKYEDFRTLSLMFMQQKY